MSDLSVAVEDMDEAVRAGFSDVCEAITNLNCCVNEINTSLYNLTVSLENAVRERRAV